MSATDQATATVVLQQLPSVPVEDTLMVRLAREIAMDIFELSEILARNKVEPKAWDDIKKNYYFQNLLRSQVEEWNSAMNTPERVRFKALACIEEVLPEFFARMHDKNELLSSKVKSLEVFSNLAGVGKAAKADALASGEKFSVTINLGADEQLRIIAPAIDTKDQ